MGQLSDYLSAEVIQLKAVVTITVEKGINMVNVVNILNHLEAELPGAVQSIVVRPANGSKTEVSVKVGKY